MNLLTEQRAVIEPQNYPRPCDCGACERPCILKDPEHLAPDPVVTEQKSLWAVTPDHSEAQAQAASIRRRGGKCRVIPRDVRAMGLRSTVFVVVLIGAAPPMGDQS